jgi:hypothetical protein
MSLLSAMSTGVTASSEWQEPEAHSFIVKIWVEPDESGKSGVCWRGSVTKVPSGERQSVNDLTEIVALIGNHLQELGVRLGTKWRIWLWLFRP